MQHRCFGRLLGSLLSFAACADPSLGSANSESDSAGDGGGSASAGSIDDDPLERGDVEGIGPGDGQGGNFSGAYSITAFDVISCGCRKQGATDFCADLGLNAEGFAFLQVDGAATLAPIVGGKTVDQVARGRVDADGAFEVGGVHPVTGDGGQAGQSFDLLEGTVRVEDSLEMTWRTRPQYVTNGGSVDCDVTMQVEAVFLSH